jgi:glycosyltransferase involved in cell wall biosynthesis
MKITIVGTAYPLRGGIAHYNALLATHLSKQHEVITVTFKRQYPSILFPGKTQDETGTVEHAEPAPQLIDSINPLNWFSVGRELRRQQPDLLIFKYWLPFFGPCFGTIAKVTKRGTTTKVLVICDNVIPHERRPGDVAFTKYFFRQADYFIVQSNAVERDLLEQFPGVTFAKVPHPVYEIFGLSVSKTEARRTLKTIKEKVILFFGYVRAYKGLMVLIEAMQHLQDVQLLCVGEFYDDETKYRQMVKDLHLESNVRFVSEYVPNENVASYFCAADIVILPYLSATQSGIAQIAYNFNRPVIATDVGGLGEVVLDEKTGFIVPPNNPAALANAVKRFYDEHREQEFVASVKIEKKKYSWDALVEEIERLVKK